MADNPAESPPGNRRKSPGGKFEPGNKAGVNTRFRPGESGNPDGRPKSGPGFRVACRSLAASLLDQLREQAEVGEISPDLVRALEVVCDRGGYLTGDKLAQAEVARGRLFVELLALPSITEEKRAELLARWNTHEKEALAEVADDAE